MFLADPEMKSSSCLACCDSLRMRIPLDRQGRDTWLTVVSPSHITQKQISDSVVWRYGFNGASSVTCLCWLCTPGHHVILARIDVLSASIQVLLAFPISHPRLSHPSYLCFFFCIEHNNNHFLFTPGSSLLATLACPHYHSSTLPSPHRLLIPPSTYNSTNYSSPHNAWLYQIPALPRSSPNQAAASCA